MTMKITMTVEGIRKAIKSVTNRSARLQDDMQDVAIACLSHTHEHGDWTLSREFVEGITKSKGVKSTKLKQYFEAMMCATYVKPEGEDDYRFVYDEDKSAADINIAMARAVKWYDFKVEGKDNSKDLEQIRESVVKMLKTSVEANKVSTDEAEALTNYLTDLVTAQALAGIAIAA